MGVQGLWKLLEAAGKPVPLETLENKVLAVDVSIWLHQMMKGFQDARGAPVPNAHLLGLFHRVCKLLYYRIKPVFVFDGGVPLLKKQTIAARNIKKKNASLNAADAKERLLMNLVKRKAIRHILHGPNTAGDTQDSTSKDDMFNLPPIPNEVVNTDSEEESEGRLHFMESSGSESELETKPSSQQLLGLKMDLHTLDVHSEEFRSLPPDVRHNILSELKETRKQNSWGRLHEMPEESGDFSNFQLGRLLKRRNVQVSLEQAEKEMGGKVMRMSELQELMTAQGVTIIEENTMLENASRRIASDSATRFVLCKDSAAAGSSQSSHSSISTNDKVDNNSLYSEQTEYITQMAENMLQQLSKIKQEPGLIIEDEKSNSHQEVITEEILDKMFSDNKPSSISSKINSADNKILTDCWSSDDDDTVQVQASVSSKPDRSASRAQNVKSPKEEIDCSTGLVFNVSKDLSRDVADKFSDVIKDDCVGTSSDNESSPVASPLKEYGSNSKPERNLNYSLVSVAKYSAEKDETLCLPKPVGTTHSPVELKKSLEIFIRPSENPVNDDIFADIFETGLINESVQHRKIQSQTKIPDNFIEERKSCEVVVCPEEKPDGDDIFADIFQPKPSSVQGEQGKPIVISCMESASLESESLSTDSAKRINIGLKTKSMEQVQDEEEQNDIENKLAAEECDITSSEYDSNMEESSGAISPLFSQPPTSSELKEMEASLEAEQLNLQKERGRQERLAASITDQMCVEAQELLQLFGLPYLVAPMEAEAQCAFLDAISLTEGSITDDSDIWLFGAKKVYKNFFNQKKHVLQFTSSNINHYFKLSREQLVQLALLVGSDYTTGIQGIGPVTALEVVAAFQSRMESDPVQSALKGLSQFKDWWNSGRPHKSNRMRHLDKKLKNVKFSEGFPSQAVVEAYLRPSVEDSQETFSWGALDLPALREYARSKFGWNVSKADEILMPVAKRWSARTSQRSIDSYFNFQPLLVEGLSKMSKRVQRAVTQMEAEDSDNVDDPVPKPSSAPKEKKAVRKHQQKAKGDKTKAGRVRSKVNEPLSDCEPENTSYDANEGIAHKTVTNASNEKIAELPVRAPTVPRERSSTGVKRVGVNSVNTFDKTNIKENFKAIGQAVCPADKNKKYQGTSVSSHQNSNRKKPPKPNEKNATVILGSSEEEGKVKGCDVEAIDSQPSGSGIKSHSVEASSSYHTPCSSLNITADLASLSEVNWEDDPWDTKTPEEIRPKVYFGGIRPNKPKRPAVSRQMIPAQTADTRGVRPGWVTRERMESRTAWIDMNQRNKKEETIPQRERDQRALEEAKMKAIEIVKASEVKQASRLLGKNIKRGRTRVRPKGKVLPEHNLSESSSDD